MRLTLIIAIVTLLSSGCDKKNEEPKKVPEAPVTGFIYGKVSHQDNDGVEYLQGIHTTTILLNGGTSMQADSSGNYRFKDLPPGGYSLTFLKKGAGVFRKTDIQLVGNDEFKLDVVLADTAAWLINEAKVRDSVIHGTPYLVFKLWVPIVDQQRYVQVFFSKNKDVNAKVPSSFNETTTFILPVHQSVCNFEYAISQLTDKGFKKESVVFVRIYPVNPNCSYWDGAMKQTIFAGTGTSYPTFSLTLPL